MKKKLTNYFELTQAVQKNLFLIYHYWKQVLIQTGACQCLEDQLILILSVNSIFSNWTERSACQFVLHDKVKQVADSQSRVELLQIYNFLYEKNMQTDFNFPQYFCVFIQSNSEEFSRSF